MNAAVTYLTLYFASPQSDVSVLIRPLYVSAGETKLISFLPPL